MKGENREYAQSEGINTHKRAKIRILSYLIRSVQTRIIVFKEVKEKKTPKTSQPLILHITKCSFKNKCETKTFSDKPNLRNPIPRRLTKRTVEGSSGRRKIITRPTKIKEELLK